MPLTPATFDPANKSTRITLAANELTTSAAAAGYSHARTKVAASSGKFYFEVTRVNGSWMFGVVPGGANLDMYAGGVNAGVGLYNGSVYRNDAVVATLAWDGAANETIGVLLDADARTVVFRSLSGIVSSAITLPFTGPIYAALGSGSSGSPVGSATANFGASAFAAPAPSGYAAGFGTATYSTVAGNVKDAAGANAARQVRFYLRSTGEFLGSTTSDPTTGNYSFQSIRTGEIQRVVLDDDAGTLYNDLIDRIYLT